MGNYTGDSSINRFIPYNLNRTAKNIDIISNLSSQNYLGKIIIPGYIFETNTGNRITVSSPNSTGFFVDGNFNLGLTLQNTTVGSTSSHSTGQEYNKNDPNCS
jgi:archaellum component FlaG (FlaF/FlaG flagellin family)